MAEYQYDALGRRIRKKIGCTPGLNTPFIGERYVYSGDRVIERYGVEDYSGDPWSCDGDGGGPGGGGGTTKAIVAVSDAGEVETNPNGGRSDPQAQQGSGAPVRGDSIKPSESSIVDGKSTIDNSPKESLRNHHVHSVIDNHPELDPALGAFDPKLQAQALVITPETLQEYIYGLDYIDEHVAVIDDDGYPTLVLQDVSYNTVALVDFFEYGMQNQALLTPYGQWHYLEDAFGTQIDPSIRPEGTTSAINYPFWYKGLWLDREIAGYYNRARTYLLSIARYNAMDPNGQALQLASALRMNARTPAAFAWFGPSHQYAEGLNGYLAFLGNPLNRLDPAGLETYQSQLIKTSIMGGLIGLVVGGVGGALGDALFSTNPSWRSSLAAGGRGALGGAVGGAAGGAMAAWIGAYSFAGMLAGAAIEGAVDSGVQTAATGGSLGEVLANAAVGAVFSGFGAGVIGGFLRVARGGADDVANVAANKAKQLVGEDAARTALSRAGYVELPARLPGDRGFDGVFVRWGVDGTIEDIIITESKYSSSGYASLAQTQTMGQQLSPQWIRANIDKMLDSADPALRQTAEFLDANQGLIRTKFNIMDSDLINRWSRERSAPEH